MMTLFNDEYILKTYIESEIRDATKSVAQRMYQEGDSVERIAKIFRISIEEAEELLGFATV